jgi:hypothetical protein
MGKGIHFSLEEKWSLSLKNIMEAMTFSGQQSLNLCDKAMNKETIKF